MESDNIESDTGKGRSKSKRGKSEAKVTIHGKEMTVKEMEETMGNPGPEFFQSSRGKATASASQGSRQQAVVEQKASEEEPKTKEAESQETPGSEEAGGKGKPESSPKEAKEDVLSDKVTGKWLKLLDAGWYPKRTRDGEKMYLRSSDSDSKSSVVPFSQHLWNFWTTHLTPIGKDAMASEPTQQDKSEAAVSQGTTLLGYMTLKATKDVPLIRNQLGKISFMQQALYDLGWMTFLKLSKAPGLLSDDLWRVTLSDDPTPENVDMAQKAREKFSEAFEQAEDILLRAMDAASEIASLDHELGLESARLLKERQNSARISAVAKYYEEYGRIALSCMPPAAMQEFFQRLMVKGLVDATEKAEIAAAKTQIPQEATPQA